MDEVEDPEEEGEGEALVVRTIVRVYSAAEEAVREEQMAVQRLMKIRQQEEMEEKRQVRGGTRG